MNKPVVSVPMSTSQSFGCACLLAPVFFVAVGWLGSFL